MSVASGMASLAQGSALRQAPTERFSEKRFETECRIDLEQTGEFLRADIVIAADIPVRPGDQIRVQGPEIACDYGEILELSRRVQVVRAGPLRRYWTRLASYFELNELFEVSFSPKRIP